MYPKPYTGAGATEFFAVRWLAESVLGIAASRPPVNAYHVAELHRLFALVRRDGDVRAVVLYSEGKCFTAGLDLRDPALTNIFSDGADPARRAFLLRDFIDRFQQAITSIETCERPVIGVAHGFTVGLGIDILSAVDVRYAARNVRFSIREAAIGLAADIGSLQRFPKVVGNDSLARELAFTARDFGADEAERIGFVSRVCETRDAAVEAAVATAQEIAAHSPVAVVGTKMALVHARDHSVDEGLRYMQYLNAVHLQTEDLSAAISAILAKQKPSFAKL